MCATCTAVLLTEIYVFAAPFFFLHPIEISNLVIFFYGKTEINSSLYRLSNPRQKITFDIDNDGNDFEGKKTGNNRILRQQIDIKRFTNCEPSWEQRNPSLSRKIPSWRNWFDFDFNAIFFRWKALANRILHRRQHTNVIVCESMAIYQPWYLSALAFPKASTYKNTRIWNAAIIFFIAWRKKTANIAGKIAVGPHANESEPGKQTNAVVQETMCIRNTNLHTY